MKKNILILLMSSSLLSAQEGRVLEKCAAFGDGVQYVYLNEWKESEDVRKVISKLTVEEVKYEWLMLGQRKFQIVESIDTTQTPIVTFNDNLAGTRLVEVKKLTDGDLRVLLYDTQGYRLYRFSKTNDVWEKKMMAMVFKFVMKNPVQLGINGVGVTDVGNLVISYENLPDENYVITENQTKITLNGVHVADAIWYANGKAVIAP